MAEEWQTRRSGAAWVTTSGYDEILAAAVPELLDALDAAEREVDSQMQSKLDAQVALRCITDSLCLTFSELGNGWTEATAKILGRIETIVDEADRGFREREEARARVEALEAALREARKDVLALNTAGFDSTRGRVAIIAIERIDKALAAGVARPEPPSDDRCPPGVCEAAALALQRDDLYDRLHRIYHAALSDADLTGMAVRDFLLRESGRAELPGVIVGLVPEAEPESSET